MTRAAAWSRLCTPSLVSTFFTYVRTVLTSTLISWAICAVLWPATILRATSFSRGVSTYAECFRHPLGGDGLPVSVESKITPPETTTSSASEM